MTKYHSKLLTLTGDIRDASPDSPASDGWTLTQLGTAEERMGIDREILELEKKLAEVEGWERRVKELGRALSVQDT